MNSLRRPNRQCPLARKTSSGNIIGHGFYQTRWRRRRRYRCSTCGKTFCSNTGTEIYKHFYSGAQGEIGEARREIGGGLGAGSELPVGNRFLSGRKRGNSLSAPNSGFAARDCASARAHLGRTGAWPASGWYSCDLGHYCPERVRGPGGARGSKGSFVLQRSLSR